VNISRRRLPVVLVVLAGLAVVGWLVLRPGGGEPGTAPGPGGGKATASPSATAGGGSDEVLRKYLSTASPTPVATVSGRLKVSGSDSPARVEVIAVEADDRSTVLRWRLVADQTGTITANLFSRGATDSDTSAIALISRETQQRMVPGRYVQGLFSRCACAKAPYRVGPRGVEMSAVFAPLASTVREIEVRIPTFAPVSVPITRS
jgi:hypothetical protein